MTNTGTTSRPDRPRLFLATLGIFLMLSLSMDAGGGDSLPGSPRLITELDPHYRESVLRGWRTFQTSYAGDGLACVSCHPNHDTIRLWYGSYPKVEVFDGTPYRVKGLRDVVSEALEKHSDLDSAGRNALVEDLVAYIAWWGDGQAIYPGHSRNLPPPLRDLDMLRSSVAKGRKFVRSDSPGSCVSCHDIETGVRERKRKKKNISLPGAVETFPRYVSPPGKVMTLEGYLTWHMADTGSEGNMHKDIDVTDIAAYLVSISTGKRLHPGGRIKGRGD